MPDQYGSTEDTTAYEGQKPPSKRETALSAWGTIVAVAFVVAMIGALLFWPQSRTDPAPGGSAGSAVTALPAPAQRSP